MPVTCPQFLRHQAYTNSEQGLPLDQEGWAQAQYRCYKFMQQKGDMIIIFPGEYHLGINTGWNLNEAVNFGTQNWLEEAKRYELCTCSKSDGTEDSAIELDIAEIELGMQLN